MAKYRKIDPRIWNDAKFRALGDRGKLVFFMLLTHPHMTAIGAMRASLDGLAAEIGWPSKAFREAFREASSKGLVKHDQSASILWLPNFLKYNQPESPNVVKAWIGAFDLLPECSLKNQALQAAKAFAEALPEAFAEAFDKAFAKAMPYPEPEPEPEPEQEQDKSLSGASEQRTLLNGHAVLHDEFVTMWNEIVVDLPRIKLWTDGRRRAFERRVRDVLKRGKPGDTSAYWRSFLESVHASDWLCGRRGNWQASVDWLLAEQNFVKVIEHTYDNRKGAA